MFAGLGAFVLTVKGFYWVSLLMNSGFFLAFVFVLVFFDKNYDNGKTIACSDEIQDRTRDLCIWALLTTFIAVFSVVSFANFQKGHTVSVTG